MSLASVAHLPLEKRHGGLVHWVTGKKRSVTGWLVLIGFIELPSLAFGTAPAGGGCACNHR